MLQLHCDFCEARIDYIVDAPYASLSYRTCAKHRPKAKRMLRGHIVETLKITKEERQKYFEIW